VRPKSWRVRSFGLDYCVLKRLGRYEVRPAWSSRLQIEKRLARATICDLEVGYSARNALEWTTATGAGRLRSGSNQAAHVDRALQVQRLLASAAQRGRRSQTLLRRGRGRGTVPSLFYPLLTPTSNSSPKSPAQPSQWCVPAGHDRLTPEHSITGGQPRGHRAINLWHLEGLGLTESLIERSCSSSRRGTRGG